MIKLEKVFKNHFENKNIGDDAFKAFSQHHLQNLIAGNTNGKFNKLISDTTKAHNNYFDSIVVEESDSTIRKSRTRTVDDIIQTFREEVSRHEGAVKYAFIKDTATYGEFYPKGMKEYNHMTKKNVETLMNRYISAAKTHKTKLGKEFLKVFIDLQSEYDKARGSQLKKKGDVQTDKTKTKNSRHHLELELLKNMHFIAFTYPGDTRKCLSFFDQQIVTHPASKRKVKGSNDTSSSAQSGASLPPAA